MGGIGDTAELRGSKAPLLVALQCRDHGFSWSSSILGTVRILTPNLKAGTKLKNPSLNVPHPTSSPFSGGSLSAAPPPPPWGPRSLSVNTSFLSGESLVYHNFFLAPRPWCPHPWARGTWSGLLPRGLPASRNGKCCPVFQSRHPDFLWEIRMPSVETIVQDTLPYPRKARGGHQSPACCTDVPGV